MMMQNMSKILEEKSERLRLMEEKNNELNRKLFQFEVNIFL